MPYEVARDQYLKKGVMQMKRFRQKIVTILGDYYFVEVPNEEAIK